MPFVTGLLAAQLFDGLGFTLELASTPLHGTIALDGSTGAFTYTPAAGFVGADAFSVAAVLLACKGSVRVPSTTNVTVALTGERAPCIIAGAFQARKAS